VRNIKEATNDGIRIVYDTISEDYTYPLVLGSIAEGKSAKISVLHDLTLEFVEKQKDVKWFGECPRHRLRRRFTENCRAQKRSSIPRMDRP